MSLYGDGFWVRRAELRRRNARMNYWVALSWVAASGAYIALGLTGWISWLTPGVSVITAAFWLVFAAANVWFAFRNITKAKAYEAQDDAMNKYSSGFDNGIAAANAEAEAEREAKQAVTSVLDLGDAPFDQREDGSIRKGDPAFDFMMRAVESGGMVHAQRRDDGKWEVTESQ